MLLLRVWCRYKFVRTLNGHVRTVRRSSLFSQAALSPVLSLLRVENHMGVGIGKNLPLGGVKVELGWVGEDSAIGGGALPALILTAKEDPSQAMLLSTTSTLNSKTVDRPVHPPSSFSRAEQLLASRLPILRRDDRSPQSSDSGRDAQRLSQSYNSSSYLTSDDDEESGPSIMERALGQTGQRKVQQYLSAKKRLEAEQAHWRAAKKQSSSYASLPKSEDTGNSNSPAAGGAYRAFGGRRADGLSRVEAPQLSSATRKKKGDRRDVPVPIERKDEEVVDLLNTSGALMGDVSPISHVHFPYSASVYHFDSSRSSSAMSSPRIRPSHRSVNSDGDTRVTSSLSSSFPLPSDTLPSPHVSLGYRLQGLVLFNVPLYLSRTLLAFLFLLLLFIRVGVSLILFSSSFQLVRWMFVFAVLLYPLAPILVPILGLIALVSSSTHACRFFSSAVLLSMVNDCIVLAGSIYSFNTSMGWIDALLLPPVAVGLTLALLLTSHAYVAHLEVLKDLVIGRREDTRDKEGEEGYGGGFVVNPSPQNSRRGSRRGSRSLHVDSHPPDRPHKERGKRGGRPPHEAETKAEDLSQPTTPSTATSDEPGTPVFAAFAPPMSSTSQQRSMLSSAPMAVPSYTSSSASSSSSSVFVPTLSPVLPTPPSMGATHSLLSSSLVMPPPSVDVGSPPVSTIPTPTLPVKPAPATPATAPLPPTPTAAPLPSVPAVTPPARIAPSAPAATPPATSSASATTTSGPTSTRSGRGGSVSSSSGPSTPVRRGRGGGRGGGGGGGGGGVNVAGSGTTVRGKTKRGGVVAKRSTG